MNEDLIHASTKLVLDALEHDRSFLTAHELHRRLPSLGRPMAISTVYGVLRTLAERNVVAVIVGEHNQRWYRRCSAGPHHHLVCTACRTTVELPVPSSLPDWTTGEATGFTNVVVRATVMGMCADCASASSLCN